MTSPKLVKQVMEWYEQGKTVFLCGSPVSCNEFLYKAYKNPINNGDVCASSPSLELNQKVDVLWDIVSKLEDEVKKIHDHVYADKKP